VVVVDSCAWRGIEFAVYAKDEQEGSTMSIVPLRVAAAVSLLKNRVVQMRVQAAAAALIVSASLNVEAQAPILGPSDAIGVDYANAWFAEYAIDRFEVQYDDGEWTSVGLPVYAAGNDVTTYTVNPTMQTGSHAVSFRVCNAAACSTPTSPFAFVVSRQRPTAVGPAPVRLVQLVAGHTSNKCLDVSGSSTENRSAVIQWQCHGGDNQFWNVEPADDGYWRMVARHSGKCLDVSGESTEDGAAVVQWQCHSGANQQWRIEPAGNGYRLVARHSGKCLDVPGWSADDGRGMTQWRCNGGANQTWLVRER
jgi:Ricin-type beta-trefoil lectin domain